MSMYKLNSPEQQKRLDELSREPIPAPGVGVRTIEEKLAGLSADSPLRPGLEKMLADLKAKGKKA
ncbi:hypothetical protein [Anatilimnocola floriformis]|uniref:hypothetical protein n=1 Tax=Anatilimnocola floriformis TaxID=2948575 RepID=UPI0020C1D2A2|nr:hypothetical protein [Anatilimnocola floriformis]